MISDKNSRLTKTKWWKKERWHYLG